MSTSNSKDSSQNRNFRSRNFSYSNFFQHTEYLNTPLDPTRNQESLHSQGLSELRDEFDSLTISSTPLVKTNCLSAEGKAKEVLLPIEDFILPNDPRFINNPLKLSESLFLPVQFSSQSELLKNLYLYFDSNQGERIPGLDSDIFNQMNEFLKPYLSRNIDKRLLDSVCFQVNTRVNRPKDRENTVHIPALDIFHSDWPRSRSNLEEWTNNQKFIGDLAAFFDLLLKDDSHSIEYYNVWINLGSPSSNSLFLATKSEPHDSTTVFPEASVVRRGTEKLPVQSIFCDDVINGKVTIHGGVLSSSQGYIFMSQSVPHAAGEITFNELPTIELNSLRKSVEVRCLGIFAPSKSG